MVPPPLNNAQYEASCVCGVIILPPRKLIVASSRSSVTPSVGQYACTLTAFPLIAKSTIPLIVISLRLLAPTDIPAARHIAPS